MRLMKLRAAGAEISHTAEIPKELTGGDVKGLVCGPNAYFSQGVKLLLGMHDGQGGKLTIGSHFFINHYSIIDCHHSITIGESVMIGPYVYICDFDHETATEIGKGWTRAERVRPVHIEREVWIGAGAIILKGVRIGEGAVIGAGSIVTKDVERGAIVAGNPARLVRMRNSEFEDDPLRSVNVRTKLVGSPAS